MKYEFDRKGFVTRQMREKRIAQEDVQRLLHALPSKMAKYVQQTFLEYQFDGPEMDKMKEFFPKNSIITADIMKNPGSPETFHYLYLSDEDANKALTEPIDKFFHDCLAGQGIRDRLHVMVTYIANTLREKFPAGEILIDNLGSGQGYDLIGVMRQNPDLAARCHVRNIDIDQKALDRGWERIVQYGLQNTFDNVCADFMKVKKRNADFILLSGIFCPTPLPLSKKGMKKLFVTFLRKGGYVMYNATTLRMLEEDPMCDFLMYNGGWQMDYKPIDDILSIATYAKLKVLDAVLDKYEYNCVVFAQK
jgi:hypothetical protein